MTSSTLKNPFEVEEMGEKEPIFELRDYLRQIQNKDKMAENMLYFDQVINQHKQNAENMKIVNF